MSRLGLGQHENSRENWLLTVLSTLRQAYLAAGENVAHSNNIFYYIWVKFSPGQRVYDSFKAHLNPVARRPVVRQDQALSVSSFPRLFNYKAEKSAKQTWRN